MAIPDKRLQSGQTLKIRPCKKPGHVKNEAVVGNSGQTLKIRPNVKNPEKTLIFKKIREIPVQRWNSGQTLKIQPNDENLAKR